MNLRSSLALVGVLLAGAMWGVNLASALPTPGSTVWVTLTSAGPQYGTIHVLGASGRDETVYMGPYGLTVGSDHLATYWLCFDASTNISLGQSWQALVTNTDLAAVSYTDGVDKFRMLAWLSTQLDHNAFTRRNANINEAMWEIMADYNGKIGIDSLNVNPTSNARGNFYIYNNDPNDIANVTNLLTDAYNHRDFTLPELILLPLDPNVQPFIIDPAVPEPGTLLLLGSGLVGLAGIGWKRHRRT